MKSQNRTNINRPLDVKYLLDELERRDKSDLSFQLNLQQVGVIGQSLGATALALAGATFNFKQLQNDCEDLSNFLECVAAAPVSRPRVTAHPV